MANQNRRQEPRFFISQLIEMSFGKERWVRATALDISRHGFRGRLSDEIDPGSAMFVLFHLEDEAVQVEAIAMHVSKNEDGTTDVGFQFTTVDERARKALDSFIDTLAGE